MILLLLARSSRSGTYCTKIFVDIGIGEGQGGLIRRLPT